MPAYMRLWSGVTASSGLVLVNGTTDTGYRRRSAGPYEGALGAVVHDPIMASSIDRSPRKVGQREGARVFPEKIEIVGSSWSDYCTKRDALIAEIRDANASNGAARLRLCSAQGGVPVEYIVQHIKTGPLTSHAAELSNRHTIDLEFTCSPYAYGDRMDVAANLGANALTTGGDYNTGGTDWTVRSGSVTATANGFVIPSSAGATLIEHTGTPYLIGDHQQTAYFSSVGLMVVGKRFGVIVKRLPSGAHLRVIVELTNTIGGGLLKIQSVSSGGVATDLGTPVSISGLTPGAAAWVRARIEGSAVIAEYTAAPAAPRPMQVPSNATQFYAVTLAGSDATSFGDGVSLATGGGIYVLPVSGTDVVVAAWDRLCFCYAGTSNKGAQGIWDSVAPFQVATTGPIPGTVRAEASVRYADSAGSLVSTIFGAWMPRRVPSSGYRPFGVLDVISATNASVVSDAAAVGGSVHTSSVVANPMIASWGIDPRSVLPDDSQGSQHYMRIIARVRIASTATTGQVSATLTNVLTNTTMLPLESALATRNLASFKPTSGTAYRLVSLGTFPVGTTVPISSTTLSVSLLQGTASTVALDCVMIVPARRAFGTMTGVDSTTLRYLAASSSLAFQVDTAGAASFLANAQTPTPLARAGGAPGVISTQILLDQGEQMDWIIGPSSMPVDQANGTVAASQDFASIRQFQISVRPRYWIGS